MSAREYTVCLIADSNLDSLVELRETLASESPHCRVITADAGRNAIELASHNPPDVVLADIRLSDMSGLKLLLRLKARHPGMITMMMSECGSLEARKMCLEAGVDFFFEKPVDLKRLSGMLEPSAPEAESVFRGTLDNLSVPDVLQLVSCRPSPMLMRIDSPRGNGSIEIEDGQVIHARANDMVGEDAFFRLVGWDEGHFEVVDVACPEERTISTSLPQLLMGAAMFLESPQAAETDGDVLAGTEGRAGFFPSEATAPETSHVLSQMANYARPKLSASTRRHTGMGDVETPSIPSMNAFRPSLGDTDIKLRFKPKRPEPQRLVQHSPAILRTRRTSYAPAARRIAVACFIAMGTLLVGARYTGLLSNQYGRDLAPIFGKLFGDFTPQNPKDRASEAGSIQASESYQDLARYAVREGEKSIESLPMGSTLPALSVSITQHEDLLNSANSVGISDAVYRRMGLHSNPWIEVTGPAGKQVGALAVLIPDAASPVLLTQELADALSSSGSRLTHVRVRKVAWHGDGNRSAMEFARSRNLSGKLCEYWYSVGLSLEAMTNAGLMPGADAEIHGPTGIQAVRVQLYDRGDAGEIWLSQPVREAIGTTTDKSASIVLYPKT